MSESLSLEAGSHVVTGRYDAGSAALPLLVCLPGGSYNATYFEVGDNSLVEEAVRQGFPVARLNRPGYAGSTPVEPVTFRGNAEVLNQAIATLWSQRGQGLPGVVLIGHSMGGAIAIHLAALERSWPLLGIAPTAIHVDAPEAVSNAWAGMPVGVSIEFTPEQRTQFMYGDPDTYRTGVIDEAGVSCEPIPVAELLEVVGGWIDDFPSVAAAVEVPVHYTLADADNLWVASEDAVRSFGSAFTASPQVETEFVRNCGHNLDHHHVAEEFHRRQLQWARTTAEHSEEGRSSAGA